LISTVHRRILNQSISTSPGEDDTIAVAETFYTTPSEMFEESKEDDSKGLFEKYDKSFLYVLGMVYIN
jgi:hypothetical protein